MTERVIFINNDDGLRLKLSPSSSASAPRQKVKINIDTKSDTTRTAIGTFSVAVINESRVPVSENSESTIVNNLLLTSDLKGYIEQPNYYFTDVNEQKRADLDVLMLTQGYRRFEWKDVLNNKPQFPAYKAEADLAVEGTLKTPSGKPIPNGQIILTSPKDGLITDTTTDANGRFVFHGLNISDTGKIVIRARKENKGSNVSIYMKQSDYPQVAGLSAKNAEADLETTTEMKKAIADYQKQDSLKNNRQLKEVIIKGKKDNRPDLSHSSNLHGGGNADQVVMGDKLGACVFVSDCLSSKVFGVTFSMGIPVNMRGGLMSVIIDGIVLPGSSLNDINASDIYSVEVLRSGFNRSVYGSSIEKGGALVITTKMAVDPNYTSKQEPPGLITYAFKGYHAAKIFYSPKYSHPKTSEEPQDLRNTIYWNANIITSKDGKASFEYFNADTKGTYRVVIEGIDDNGKIGRAVYRYKVE